MPILRKATASLAILVLACLALAPAAAFAQPVEPLWSLVQKERRAMLHSLKSLVEIESGSADAEGLDSIASLVAGRLEDLGGVVEHIESGPEIYRMFDTPGKTGRMVRATFKGTGTKKILLMAHMDTVYPHGMIGYLPFKIGQDRVWGLGIADDKQGIAVILHCLSLLANIQFLDYGTLTILINGDVERRRPPLQPTEVSRSLAAHAVSIYAEIGRKLEVHESVRSTR